MAHALARHGVQVDYLFSGRPAEEYFDMQPFGSYRTLPGLSFASRNGRLSPWLTLQQIQLRRFWQDTERLSLAVTMPSSAILNR